MTDKLKERARELVAAYVLLPDADTGAALQKLGEWIENSLQATRKEALEEAANEAAICQAGCFDAPSAIRALIKENE